MIPKRSSETIQKILSSRSISSSSSSSTNAECNSNYYGRGYTYSRHTAASSISSAAGLTTSTSTSTSTAATMVQQQEKIRRERSHYYYNSNSIDDRHGQWQKRVSSYSAPYSTIPCPSSTLTLTSTSTSMSTPHPNSNSNSNNNNQKSLFHTESEYHQAADDTLNTIQDTLEYYFEDNISNSSNSNSNFEINFASGVLTISLVPDHGTWVLNKQTPNRQIWWSSPLSGPRRYEYEESSGKWVWTKYIDYYNAQNGNDGGSESGGAWTEDSTSLGEALKIEMIQLFQIEDGLEDLDNL